MKIQTKMLKRLVSILCAATISSSCMITSVGAAHENEQVDQDNRSNSELQKEIDFWNKCLNNKTASGKYAMEIRAEIRQLREQITNNNKKQIELDKALENLKKEIKKFEKWSKKHNNSKRLVDLIGNLVDRIGNIDCNSNAPFKASEIDKIINEANKAIAKLQLHMSECEKQKTNDRLAYEKAQKERTNNKRENNTQNKETIKNNIVSQTEEENGEYEASEFAVYDKWQKAESEYDAAVDEYNSAIRERYSADVGIDMANIDLKAAKTDFSEAKAEGNKNEIRKGYGKYISAKLQKTKAKDKRSAAIAKGKAADRKIKCKEAEEKKLWISVVKGILCDLEKEIDTYNKFTIDNDKIVISESDPETSEIIYCILDKDKMKSGNLYKAEFNKAELNKVRTPIVERVLKDYEENEKIYEDDIFKKLTLGIFRHKCVDLLISEANSKNNPRLKMVNMLNNKNMNKIIIEDITSKLNTIKAKTELNSDDVNLLCYIANAGMSIAESLIQKRKEPSGLNHEETIELHSLVIMQKDAMEQMKRIVGDGTKIKSTLNDLNQWEEELNEELEEQKKGEKEANEQIGLEPEEEKEQQNEEKEANEQEIPKYEEEKEEQNERTELVAKKLQKPIDKFIHNLFKRQREQKRKQKLKSEAMNYVKTLAEKAAEKAFLNRKKNFLDEVQKLYELQRAMITKLLEDELKQVKESAPGLAAEIEVLIEKLKKEKNKGKKKSSKNKIINQIIDEDDDKKSSKNEIINEIIDEDDESNV